MARRFCVCGNLQMNGNTAEIADICHRLTVAEPLLLDTDIELVLAVPAPYIPLAQMMLPPSVAVAGQNCHKMIAGAYTGEISAPMLADCGARWVLLGHSNRRRLFGETDELVAEKVACAISAGLTVIVCIGETERDRECDETDKAVCRQCTLLAASIADWSNVVIAYEPATLMDAHQVQQRLAMLRRWLADNVSAAVSAATRILYGGTVTEANCGELAAQPDIDGFLLVGELASDIQRVISCAKR